MTSFLDKGSFIAIFIVLSLMPIVSHAGGLGVAPLMFILGVLGLVLAVKTKRFKITITQIMLAIFLGWLCLSALWSPYKPDDLLTNYLKLFLMVLIYYWSWPLFKYARKRRAKHLQHLFMATTFFAAGLLVIDLLSQFGITLLFNPTEDHSEKALRIADAEMNLGHSITVLVLLAAPVAMMMRERLPKQLMYPVIGLFLSLIVWAAWLIGLTVGMLGLVCVIIAAIAGYCFPKKTPVFLLMMAIFVIMGAPLLAYVSSEAVTSFSLNLPMSWDHRLRMWGYCWEVISAHPFRGAGFDASRTFDETFIAGGRYTMTIVSLHPHNVGIQIWTEAGLIGALLASAVIVTLFKPVQNFVQSRAHGSAVSGVIIGALVISSLTYGAWQFWWWGCLFLALGVLHLLPNPKEPLPLIGAI